VSSQINYLFGLSYLYSILALSKEFYQCQDKKARLILYMLCERKRGYASNRIEGKILNDVAANHILSSWKKSRRGNGFNFDEMLLIKLRTINRIDRGGKLLTLI